MPTSDPTNKLWSIREIKRLNPKTILDVGTGVGDYLALIRSYLSPDIVVDGVEVWQPYVEEYSLKERYDHLFVQDVREMTDFNYDLIIFGDVLEHMPEKDSARLWATASQQAKYGLISIPLGHHPQGAYAGNPYEVHHEEDWDVDKVLKTFPGIIRHKTFDITGVFIARF